MRIYDALAVGLLAGLCACSPRTARGYLATDTPYRAPAAADGPAGLEPVFIDHLGRHGSRYYTSPKDMEKMLATLEYARSEGALYRRGEDLEAAVRGFMKASDFGQVTPLAAEQQRGIARRMYHRAPGLFRYPGGRKVLASATYKKRAQDTRDAFLAELASLSGADPRTDFTTTVSTGCQTLRFFDCDAGYRAYKKGRSWLLTPYYLSLAARTRKVSGAVLGGFFSKDFLDGMDSGKQAPNGTFSSSTEMAAALYKLYAMEQQLPERRFGFRKYFDRAQLAWFEYLDDYNAFYEKGPGYPGSSITFAMGAQLLRDFLDTTERAAEDPAGSPAAVLRFAHAETVMPMAALMKLSGASEQAAEYPFAGRRWKSAEVAPMSANIQWLLFRRKDGGCELEILLNERPVLIDAPLPHNGYFYDWPAVREFYENLLAGLPGPATPPAPLSR